MHPDELETFKLNHELRRSLLQHLQEYYALHIHDFGQLKTLKVLADVLS
jgi:DNA repair protein RecO (recombination protein O)